MDLPLAGNTGPPGTHKASGTSGPPEAKIHAMDLPFAKIHPMDLPFLGQNTDDIPIPMRYR